MSLALYLMLCRFKIHNGIIFCYKHNIMVSISLMLHMYMYNLTLNLNNTVAFQYQMMLLQQQLMPFQQAQMRMVQPQIQLPQQIGDVSGSSLESASNDPAFSSINSISLTSVSICSVPPQVTTVHTSVSRVQYDYNQQNPQNESSSSSQVVSYNMWLYFENPDLLNQACIWFLEIAFVHNVGMCVCPPLRL